MNTTEKLLSPRTFADKLKKLREQRGVTMQKMSQTLGFAKSTIHAWENGDRRPKSWETIQMIAKYFGVPCEYFYDDQEAQDKLQNILIRLESLEKEVEEIKQSGVNMLSF